jgi:dihydrofolate synthase / folylpolyglutamate synthase
MIINAYKTHKILPNENIFEILNNYLPHLEEKSIVAVASKIVGLCEGRAVEKHSDEQKDHLVKKEADLYLPQTFPGFSLTIKHNLIVANAGIDESNSNGYLSLWPKDPQKSANEIREYFIKKSNLKNIGVILTDSKLTPLRMGVTGYAISHSGFAAINSYVGKLDIFGRKLSVEQLNVADSLATSAVAVMGEGNEQQPLAVITDIPFVQFQQRTPTDEELENLKITQEDDMYAPLLTSVRWKTRKES